MTPSDHKSTRERYFRSPDLLCLNNSGAEYPVVPATVCSLVCSLANTLYCDSPKSAIFKVADMDFFVSKMFLGLRSRCIMGLGRSWRYSKPLQICLVKILA